MVAWTLLVLLGLNGRRCVVPRITLELSSAGEPARRLVFDKTEVVVGRSGSSDVVLDEDQISRFHCRLTFKDGRWRLSDTGSANGVFLDRGGRGAPFLARHDVVVSGDHLYLGHYRLRVELEEPDHVPVVDLPLPPALDDGGDRTAVLPTLTQGPTVLVKPLQMRAALETWLQRPEAESKR